MLDMAEMFSEEDFLATESMWKDEAKCKRLEVHQWVAVKLSVTLSHAVDAWFPHKGGDSGKHARIAKAVCNGEDGSDPCPVLYICREHAITVNEKFGIWGGMSEPDRSKLRRSRRRYATERGRTLRRGTR